MPFDRVQARLLPLADVVMIVMLSRPESGTLSNTRVTIVTNVLATAVALAIVAFAVVLLVRRLQGSSAAWLLLEVPLALAGVGFGDLAAYGIRQRFLLRSLPRDESRR